MNLCSHCRAESIISYCNNDKRLKVTFWCVVGLGYNLFDIDALIRDTPPPQLYHFFSGEPVSWNSDLSENRVLEICYC